VIPVAGEVVRGSIMKMSQQSWNARKHFGEFLQEQRAKTPLSLYDLGYVLDLNYGTPWEWEKGTAFPGNILRLKQLALVYPGVYEELRRIFQMPGVAPSKAEWDEFVSSLKMDSRVKMKELPVRRRHSDVRVDRYKRAFGDYLRENRMECGYTARSLAHGLGLVQGSACIKWEAGLCFPQEITHLIMLDRLYGDALEVIFGICPERGIHLRHGEKKAVLGRLGEFKGASYRHKGKPRVEAVSKYHHDYWMRQKRERVLTDGQFRALSILSRRGPMTLRGFARAMWPNSECWGKKVARVGPFGSVSGPGQMNSNAGMFLGELHRQKLVKKVTSKDWKREKYDISAEGSRSLRRKVEKMT